MGVKMFSADRVFDGTQFLEKGTVVAVDERGEVLNLFLPGVADGDVQHLAGILTPGLINAHCHLELSHFQASIKEGTGLTDFLLAVVTKRKEPQDPGFVQEKIMAAEAEMRAAGIVGVGDICNTNDAVDVKRKSSLHWHNLVEVLNFSDATLAQRMAHNRQVLEAYIAAGLANSGLTPHAPYSVTGATFAAINEATKGSVVSVHNQETAAEDELFAKGTGALLQLYNLTGTFPPPVSGQSSIKTWLSRFTAGQTVLLVHNTYTQKDDIQFAKAHAAANGLKLVWCLCPGANKYIENRMPPLQLLLDEDCTVVLGTDSYSSNWQLSIAAEVRLLTQAYPQVPLEILLRAATSNGAAALGWTQLGRLEKGTKPHLALLHTDTDDNLTGTSELIA